MLGRMVFRIVVGMVGAAAFPVDMKLSLANAVLDPIVSHIHGLRASLLDAGSLTMSLTVLLSVTMGVGGWGWPSSLKVMRSGTASLPL
jgi:hypothetical protein